MLQNMSRLSELSIQEAAELCLTSPATISRIAKKVGYNGFQGLKEAAHHFAQGYFNENRKLTVEQLKQGAPAEIYLSQLIDLFTTLKGMLDGEQMAQAAALLNEAEKVLCFGTTSYAEQLQMDLFYVGKSSEVLHGFIVDTAQRISCKTLAIIFDPGYPWFTMQEQIKYFVSAEAKVILISSQKREELESLVDLVFHFPGTGTSMDGAFYYVFMSIFSMEYRKRYIDPWYFSND